MKRRAATTPLADALERVGDRWTLLVVASLLDGPKRFNELQDEVDGIAPNVLSSRLKALTEQALIVAQPYSERPPRFAYELSESGRELAGALRLLADWGARSRRRGAVPARRLRLGARGALVVPELRDRRRRSRRRRRSSTSEAGTSARRCRRARRDRARTPPRGRSTLARTKRAGARPASSKRASGATARSTRARASTYRSTSPHASHAVSASMPIDTFSATFGRAASVPHPPSPRLAAARLRPAAGRDGRPRPAAPARRRRARTPRAPAHP